MFKISWRLYNGVNASLKMFNKIYFHINVGPRICSGYLKNDAVVYYLTLDYDYSFVLALWKIQELKLSSK